MDQTSPGPDNLSPHQEPSPRPSPRGRGGRGEGELAPAVAAILASIDRLDELGLEAVEPATTFGWRPDAEP